MNDLFIRISGIIGLVIGISTRTCICGSANVKLLRENQKLSREVANLNEQVAKMKQIEGFLFSSYCKSDQARRRMQGSFERLQRSYNEQRRTGQGQIQGESSGNTAKPDLSPDLSPTYGEEERIEVRSVH